MGVKDWIVVIAAAQMFFAPLAVMGYRIWTKSQGFSVHTIQFTTVMLIIPALVIFSLEDVLEKQTLATLIGGLVGYLLSGVTEKGD